MDAGFRTGRGCALLIVTGILLSGCRGDSRDSVSVVGSTSIQPFAEMLAGEFHRVDPRAQVEVQGGGSTAGIQAVANGIADIGMCSRALKASEETSFTPVVVARDGLAVVVHPSNPVADLSLGQIREIFAGRFTDWSQVGGKAGVIRPITREEGSGTREAFAKLVMEGDRIARKALTQESNGAVKELIRNDRAAIGYMSLGLVGKELGILAVDGVVPTHAAVIDGSYPLVRPFLFVYKVEPVGTARAFLDFTLSAAGQALLEKEGLVRAK